MLTVAEDSAAGAWGVSTVRVIRRTSGLALTDLLMRPVSIKRTEEKEAGPLLFVHSVLYSSAPISFHLP